MAACPWLARLVGQGPCVGMVAECHFSRRDSYAMTGATDPIPAMALAGAELGVRGGSKTNRRMKRERAARSRSWVSSEQRGLQDCLHLAIFWGYRAAEILFSAEGGTGKKGRR